MFLNETDVRGLIFGKKERSWW